MSLKATPSQDPKSQVRTTLTNSNLIQMTTTTKMQKKLTLYASRHFRDWYPDLEARKKMMTNTKPPLNRKSTSVIWACPV